MALTYHFFRYAFGEDGDLTSVPDGSQAGGSVSYQDGWTADYQLTYGTTNAKAVDRSQTNQMFNDVTLALQQYQTVGCPEWISAADNGGSSFEYPLYARVRYDAGSGVQEYENQVADNTATPGADSSWRVISGGAEGVPVGTILDFASPVVPSGYLGCDGSSVSRTTYAALFSAITFAQTATFTSASATVTGLTNATTQMYVGMELESPSIPAGTTVLSVDAADTITLSQNATASGDATLTSFPNGNGDGSSTFDIPDLRRRVAVGSGGTGTSDLGNITGETGGEEGHVQTEAELAAHVHSPLTGSGFYTKTTGETFGGANVTFGEDATTGSTGSSEAMNVIQPSLVVTKIIKY